jgi:cytochrome oxidase Cu insertion factor (SCO1/SenC/PrrC family)
VNGSNENNIRKGERMRRIVLLAALALSTAGLASAAETPRARPVAVGETAPDFTLQDQNGQKVGLAASRGQRPVVLVFYRGYW